MLNGPKSLVLITNLTVLAVFFAKQLCFLYLSNAHKAYVLFSMEPHLIVYEDKKIHDVRLSFYNQIFLMIAAPLVNPEIAIFPSTQYVRTKPSILMVAATSTGLIWQARS